MDLVFFTFESFVKMSIMHNFSVFTECTQPLKSNQWSSSKLIYIRLEKRTIFFSEEAMFLSLCLAIFVSFDCSKTNCWFLLYSKQKEKLWWLWTKMLDCILSWNTKYWKMHECYLFCSGRGRIRAKVGRRRKLLKKRLIAYIIKRVPQRKTR